MLPPLLEQFQALAKPSRSNYPWHHYHQGGQHSFHLVICSIIHGNETGSLPAIIKLLQGLQNQSISFGGNLTVILGNPEAARQNVRFLEHDLNRMFLNTPHKTHEATRAQELLPLITEGDLLIDLHQTIRKTLQPFYICPVTKPVLLWARALSVTKSLVNATPKNLKQSTTRCADELMYEQGKPALTIELSEKGFNKEAEHYAFKACTRAFALIDQIQNKSCTLKQAAQLKPALKIYETILRAPYPSVAHQLKEGLCNFMPISKGELLSHSSSPVIEAEQDGLLLFPKYPDCSKPLPKHIYRIIQEQSA